MLCNLGTGTGDKCCFCPRAGGGCIYNASNGRTEQQTMLDKAVVVVSTWSTVGAFTGRTYQNRTKTNGTFAAISIS